MDVHAALRDLLSTADMIGLAYITDLSDAELMQRPHPKCNHLNWQVGHLIVSENGMLSQIATMPALPEGFAEKYAKESADCNDASKFATKDELLAAYKAQRAGTLAALEQLSAEELDAASGISYAPTKGAVISMQGCHWLMHCGQWVIVRRENDKPILI